MLTVHPGFAVERVGRTLVVGDIENDGDLDLLVTNNGQPVDLLRNDGGNRGHSVLVKLIGNPSNRDGIGARLLATVGKQTSYLGQSDLRAHFGIGNAAEIDRLEIRWPSGRTNVIDHLRANHLVTIAEGGRVTQDMSLSRR